MPCPSQAVAQRGQTLRFRRPSHGTFDACISSLTASRLRWTQRARPKSALTGWVRMCVLCMCACVGLSDRFCITGKNKENNARRVALACDVCIHPLYLSSVSRWNLAASSHVKYVVRGPMDGSCLGTSRGPSNRGACRKGKTRKPGLFPPVKTTSKNFSPHRLMCQDRPAEFLATPAPSSPTLSASTA